MSLCSLRPSRFRTCCGSPPKKSLRNRCAQPFTEFVVASVGPSTSETLRENNLPVDFEPSHPKMGFLVNETSQRAREILQSKQ